MDIEIDITPGEEQRWIEEVPKDPIEPPRENGSFELDQAVIDGG